MQIISSGNLFFGKNKKNISVSRLLKILPTVLNISKAGFHNTHINKRVWISPYIIKTIWNAENK